MDEEHITGAGGPPLPLEGLRVLDVSSILGAPVTATFLADFGAEVIKVELPEEGEPTRSRPGPLPGLSFIWLQESRNKRSITLDLHHSEGQMLLRRLASLSDALIENFRPGTLERWNLSPEALLAENPRLVIFRFSGFGQTGSNRAKGAFDRIASAYGGVQYVSGSPDAPPMRAGYALADYMGAYVGAFAMMLALYWRDASGGGGQVIDLALYEPVLRASEMSIPQHHHTGYVRERTGNYNPFVVPSSTFQTADRKWIVIGANTDRLWERLANAMERADLLDDPRFSDLDARCQNADDLYPVIEEWVKSKEAEALLDLLEDAQVPVGMVNSIADIFQDHHIQERGNIELVNDPRFGELAVPAVLPKFSETPGSIRHLGPDLGADNSHVYGDLLGLSDAEIEELKRKQVI